MDISGAKIKIMSHLNGRNAAPALEIAAVKDITENDLEIALDELETEGSVRIRGGEHLHNQVVIKRFNMDAFECSCGNHSYQMNFFSDNCPKCGKRCLYWARIIPVVVFFLAGVAAGLLVFLR